MSEEDLIREWVALKEPEVLTPAYLKFCKRLANSFPSEEREKGFAGLRQDLAVESIRKFAPLVYDDLVNKRI